MRKTALALVLAIASCLSLNSCLAGPHQMKRSVDGWDQEMYISSPWLNAVLWVVPVYPLAHFGAAIVDFFVIDAYTFWIKDAWDGKGTAFQHYQPEATDGTMQSLLIDGSEFLKVDK